jgi:hypothetical protein
VSCGFVLPIPGGDGVSCRQPLFEEGLCRYHWHLAVSIDSGDRPTVDPYYHRKVLAGLLSPSWGISDAQHRAVLETTEPKSDGRPSDAWVIPEG